MKRGGFITADVLTGITLLGLIVVGLAVSMNGFSAFNQYEWTRQRCTAAAVAQLDSLTATGRPIEPEQVKRLWPKVETTIETTPGQGPWQGLEQVRVTAVGSLPGTRQVTVCLTRYIRPNLVAGQGGQP